METGNIYLADGYLGANPDVANFLIFNREDIAPGMGPTGSYYTQDFAWGVSARDGIETNASAIKVILI
jgi:hypothetical protein